METKRIETLSEFSELLESFDDSYLFRGQVNHYENLQGLTEITTSFFRQGCHSPTMFKWTHYAQALLRAMSSELYEDISIETSQAILQHYGWRSFFVDVSKSAQIACWFASNQFNQKRSIHMSEDWQESPVWLVYNQASYAPVETDGHIYVFNINTLKELELKLHDLTEMIAEGFTPRHLCQKGCLIGPIQNAMPESAIEFHLIVKNTVLKEVCSLANLDSTEKLFPGPKLDTFLKLLREVPWKRINIDSPIPTYTRGLQLPEYEVEYSKWIDPKVALFNNFWVSDNRDTDENPLLNSLFILIPEVLFYCGIVHNIKLPSIEALMSQTDSLVLNMII